MYRDGLRGFIKIKMKLGDNVVCSVHPSVCFSVYQCSPSVCVCFICVTATKGLVQIVSRMPSISFYYNLGKGPKFFAVVVGLYWKPHHAGT